MQNSTTVIIHGEALRCVTCDALLQFYAGEIFCPDEKKYTICPECNENLTRLTNDVCSWCDEKARKNCCKNCDGTHS